MPWFITSICSDEILDKLRREMSNQKYERPQRTFGFFNTKEEVCNAIKNNFGNMEECFYDYIVLEYIEPGIHPTVHAIEWYKWSNIANRWFSIDKKCPKEFEKLTNFALG
jgi:hypothetical protein